MVGILKLKTIKPTKIELIFWIRILFLVGFRVLSEETDYRSLTILEIRKGKKETDHFPPIVIILIFHISHFCVKYKPLS